MHAYEVEFVPARLSPVRISDAMRAEVQPAPHVPVGDPATPGQGVRIPLTPRLVATFTAEAPLIERAKPFRDPKSGRIVLGVEPVEEAQDSRAIVLLSASSGFAEGLSLLESKGIAVLARGAVGTARQWLMVWPDGAGLAVEDPVREERYKLRRSGADFERVALG